MKNRLRSIFLSLGFALACPSWADSNGNFSGVGSLDAYNQSCPISNQANACMRQGDIERAISLYKKSISIYPSDSATYHALGTAFQKIKKFEDSIDSFRKAVELEPKWVSAWIGIGLGFESLGKLTDAEKYYRKAVEINPNSYTAVGDLGDILRQQRRYKEARTWLLKAKSLPEDKMHPGQIDNILLKIEQAQNKEASTK